MKIEKTVFLLFAIIGLIQAQCPRYDGPPAGVLNAVAVINGRTANGSVITGKVTFTQQSANSSLVISANITGLDAGQGSKPHGLHIHTLGIQVWSSDVTTTCNSAGAHFNPCNTTHSSKNATETSRHVGDYGNVMSDNDGKLVVAFTDSVSQLYGSRGILGRTIVLHALADDLGQGGNSTSLANGNSGTRIACGVIGTSQ